MKLHITNGDCAGDMLQEAEGIDGEVLCWRDLLHDGPVLSEPALNREARIDFLTELLVNSDLDIDDPKALVTKDFTERDRETLIIPNKKQQKKKTTDKIKSIIK